MLVAERLRQTSSVGGASDTEHTAVAVKPVLPACPSVVMTCTAAPRRLIASRNSVCSTLLASAMAAKAPAMSGCWSIQLMAAM
jgi:hypothetical protein